jgi:hypothetical protein
MCMHFLTYVSTSLRQGPGSFTSERDGWRSAALADSVSDERVGGNGQHGSLVVGAFQSTRYLPNTEIRALLRIAGGPALCRRIYRGLGST